MHWQPALSNQSEHEKLTFHGGQETHNFLLLRAVINVKSWKIWQKMYPVSQIRFDKKWVISRRNLRCEQCSVGYYSFHIHSVVTWEY